MCQPQQRNMHGRIFGGFLMRRAFELGFATTYLFAGSRPSFVRVDEVTFRCVRGCWGFFPAGWLINRHYQVSF